MTLTINSVTADSILRCKKDSQEVLKHIRLVNPQVYDTEILFDVVVDLPDNYSISSKYEGYEDFIVITLSNLGHIELNTKEFRDIIIM